MLARNYLFLNISFVFFYKTDRQAHLHDRVGKGKQISLPVENILEIYSNLFSPVDFCFVLFVFMMAFRYKREMHKSNLIMKGTLPECFDCTPTQNNSLQAKNE